MSKKYLVIIGTLMIGMLLTGCGARKELKTLSAKSGNKQNIQDSELLTEEEAIGIVLEKVSGAGESDVWIELEKDNGNWKYEGEIRYNNREYEFEIDAKTGAIYKWSEEQEQDK